MGSIQRPQPRESGKAGRTAPRYLHAAQQDDVMMEQFEYLLKHGSSECTSQCSDCARLEKIRRHLLSPFRVAQFQGAKHHHYKLDNVKDDPLFRRLTS